jgi:hypothetical protein
MNGCMGGWMDEPAIKRRLSAGDSKTEYHCNLHLQAQTEDPAGM